MLLPSPLLLSVPLLFFLSPTFSNPIAAPSYAPGYSDYSADSGYSDYSADPSYSDYSTDSSYSDYSGYSDAYPSVGGGPVVYNSVTIAPDPGRQPILTTHPPVVIHLPPGATSVPPDVHGTPLYPGKNTFKPRDQGHRTAWAPADAPPRPTTATTMVVEVMAGEEGLRARAKPSRGGA